MEKMSFSAKVKEELSTHMSSARHCQIAELAAIISICGRISISSSDRYRVTVHTENITVARKYFTLIKKHLIYVLKLLFERTLKKEVFLFRYHCKARRGSESASGSEVIG